jgi:hypothetical protein
MDVKKGDTIIYEFAGSITEAKVLKVVDPYVKVKHKDVCLFGFLLLGFNHFFHKERILGKLNVRRGLE